MLLGSYQNFCSKVVTAKMIFHQRGCVSAPALTRAVEKFLEIPSFDKQLSGVPSKNIFSLLHSFGIQLIPVES